MDVTYFRPRRPGPEAILETAVASRLSHLFRASEHPRWVAGSLPVGAGMPDLVLMTYEPDVLAIADTVMPTSHVLAYLRSVSRAKLDTIVDRLRRPRKIIVRCLDALVDAQAVQSGDDVFHVSRRWREILPEVVTIEAKISNWQSAVAQAARNRIFSHRSFVALPQNVADRVKSEVAFQSGGIGLLSVSEDHQVEMIQDARSAPPRVWTYYYQLAATVARHLGKDKHAVRCTDRPSEAGLP